MQYHVTSDDFTLRPSSHQHALAHSKPNSECLQPHRNTWPSSLKERKAGSYAFDTVPTLVKTPWEHERALRRPRSQHFRQGDHKPLPRRIFAQVPREVYHCILDQLESLHTTPWSVNAAGRQASLKSVLFVDKRWHRVAREHLYRDVWLPSNDDSSRRAISAPRAKTPLKLLLRTLEESPGLAYLVRHLRVTAALAIALDSGEGSAGGRSGAYETLVEIISHCLNLELLSGYTPAICDELSIKLASSLVQRTKLRAHVWKLGTADLGSARLRRFDSDTVVNLHRWQQLETLVLSSSSDRFLGSGVLPAILQQLPSLNHLMLSGLCRQDYH